RSDERETSSRDVPPRCMARASVLARGCPDVDAAVGRIALDLFEFDRGEVQLLKCAEVLLELFDAARPDQCRGHPRVAERPGKRELRKCLAATFGDLVQRAYLGHRLLAELVRRHRTGPACARALGDSGGVAVSE